jgi:hypothetical protein
VARAVVLGVLCVSAHARTGEPPPPGSAQDIARKSRERGSLNLLDLTAELRMVTTGSDGKAKEQTLVSSARKISGRVHTMARFMSPPGVAGVAVLTVEGEGDAPDEISLYLPKLKRVRKVARTQRGESFMQTDFAYADLGSTGGAREEDLRLMPEQAVDGRPCHVLRGEPGADSPYGQVTVFVDKETYVPLRAEYRDRDGALMKVYRALKQSRFKGRTLATEAVMENVKQGSKTTLTVLRLEESRLGDDAFTERALERG